MEVDLLCDDLRVVVENRWRAASRRSGRVSERSKEGPATPGKRLSRAPIPCRRCTRYRQGSRCGARCRAAIRHEPVPYDPIRSVVSKRARGRRDSQDRTELSRSDRLHRPVVADAEQHCPGDDSYPSDHAGQSKRRNRGSRRWSPAARSFSADTPGLRHGVVRRVLRIPRVEHRV
jgi:hypothetical protein